jgi:hypothetical protein
VEPGPKERARVCERVHARAHGVRRKALAARVLARQLLDRRALGLDCLAGGRACVGFCALILVIERVFLSVDEFAERPRGACIPQPSQQQQSDACSNCGNVGGAKETLSTACRARPSDSISRVAVRASGSSSSASAPAAPSTPATVFTGARTSKPSTPRTRSDTASCGAAAVGAELIAFAQIMQVMQKRTQAAARTRRGAAAAPRGQNRTCSMYTSLPYEPRMPSGFMICGFGARSLAPPPPTY